MAEEPAENQIRPGRARARREAEPEETSPRKARDPEGPGTASSAPGDPPKKKRSLEKGDLPEHLRRIYLAEPSPFGGHVAYYAGPDAKAPAFRDHGGHLATHRSDPAAIRHMVEIAAHRGWERIEVRGADDFRREVWLEAKARGLEVSGFNPKARDREALERRLESEARDRTRTAGGPSPETRSPRRSAAERADDPPGAPAADRMIEGRLLALGEAPYRHREGKASTPFVRIEPEPGRTVEVWGVTLPSAVRRAGAEIGDWVRLRREGAEAATLRTPGPQAEQETSAGVRPVREAVRRNLWVMEAERFREASPREAAADKGLFNAQSHLQVIETLARERLKDTDARQRVAREARNLIVEALKRGDGLEGVRVQELQRVLQPLEPARGDGKGRSQDRDEREGPERTRQR